MTEQINRGGQKPGVMRSTWLYFRVHPWLYLMLIPSFIYILIFSYLPMYGVVIAFKDFDLVKGIFGSEWIGLKNFESLFKSRSFKRVFTNSVEFSLLRIIINFPAPIILAILLNELRSLRFKKAVQTIIYIPHFVSWVVVAGIVKNLLSASPTSFVNSLLAFFGKQPVNLLIDKGAFRWIIVFAEMWKGAGWGTIIYLSALTRIDADLYEAAYIDGAGKLKCIWHITLPGITSTIVVMLILRLGTILNNGFEQVFLLYSTYVYDVADVFETYIYRIGLMNGKFGYSAAIGLFQSLVGCILVFGTNAISRKVGDSSLF